MSVTREERWERETETQRHLVMAVDTNRGPSPPIGQLQLLITLM